MSLYNGGTFLGAGVKTVVLFFEKGAPTRKIWYYKLDPGRNLGKTNPLNDADLAEFVKLQKTKADSPRSWSVDIKGIDKATFDLFQAGNTDGVFQFESRGMKELLRSYKPEEFRVRKQVLRDDALDRRRFSDRLFRFAYREHWCGIFPIDPPAETDYRSA